jgi:hypothetical protein
MNAPTHTSERRTRHDIRAIFPAACAALKPFFDPASQWAGMSHEHLALRTLKEQFPSLGPQESYMVVTTVKRLISNSSHAPK